MLEQRIDRVIRPALVHEGYDVVCVRIIGQTRRTVQIFIERTDEQPVNVDDCARASPLIAALLDVDDPIKEAYTLEVSSPGLARPLWRFQDYERFCGHQVKFQTDTLFEGQKRFVGTIQTVQDEIVVFTIHHEGREDSILSIPYSHIQKAQLVYP